MNLPKYFSNVDLIDSYGALVSACGFFLQNKILKGFNPFGLATSMHAWQVNYSGTDDINMHLKLLHLSLGRKQV